MTGSTLDADLVAMAAALRDEGIVPVAGADVQEVRDYVDRVNAFVGRTSQALKFEQMLLIAGPHGDVPVKLYWPDGGEQANLLFYAHGGGFRQGSLAGWDAPLRQLVRQSGVAVLSIGYRLSPEHRFPVAFDEVVAVMRATIERGSIAGRPVTAFAAGGDSAGANLVLGATIALRDAGIKALRHLMLFYGVYSRDLATTSWTDFGDFGLTAAAMRGVWHDYLANDEQDWRVQPLNADLTGLPPTRLVIGDLDPLLDDNIALDAKLRASGVRACLTIVPSVNHGVIRYAEVAPVVRAMLDVEGETLRRAFL